MRLRRDRFADLIRRQLDLFAEDEEELFARLEDAEQAYDAAVRGGTPRRLTATRKLLLENIARGSRELRDRYAETLGYKAEVRAGFRARRDRASEATAGVRRGTYADRGLRPDRRYADGRARGPRRIDRLVCVPRFDSGACFAACSATPRTAGGCSPRARSIAVAALPRRHARAGDRVHRPTTARCASSTSCPRGTRPTSCGSSRASRAVCRCGWSSSSASTTARSCPWVRRRDDGTGIAIGGPDALASHAGAAQRRGPDAPSPSSWSRPGERYRSC